MKIKSNLLLIFLKEEKSFCQEMLSKTQNARQNNLDDEIIQWYKNSIKTCTQLIERLENI